MRMKSDEKSYVVRQNRSESHLESFRNNKKSSKLEIEFSPIVREESEAAKFEFSADRSVDLLNVLKIGMKCCGKMPILRKL